MKNTKISIKNGAISFFMAGILLFVSGNTIAGSTAFAQVAEITFDNNSGGATLTWGAYIKLTGVAFSECSPTTYAYVVKTHDTYKK